MINKIFNWKVVSILYLFVYIILSIASFPLYNTDSILFPDIEAIFNLLMLFIITIGFGYCFANGWKIQLFSKKFSIIYAITVFCFIPIAFVYYCFDFTVSMGDIFIGILASFITIVCFVFAMFPAIIGYSFYMTKYKEFSCVEKPAHKIISSYIAVNAFCYLIIMLLFKTENFLEYNSFDYLGIVISFLALPFTIAYAWNKKTVSSKFSKTFFVLFVVSNMLSFGHMSSQFKTDFFNFSLNSIIGVLFSLIQLLYIIFVLYKYAFTDKVRGNEQN